MAIELTERAAIEVKRLMKVKEVAPESGVRLSVKGGGCSGYSYMIDLEDSPRDVDIRSESQGIPLFVDPKSGALVDGTVIDYDKTNLGGGFTFANPKAKGTCGCGTSFTI